MSTKLDLLLQKRDQLQARIRREAAKAREKEHRNDTRQKILLGAFLKGWMEADPKIASYVDKALPDFLDKARDFELFGLPVPADVAEKALQIDKAKTPAQAH
jgi:hypothetical protein